MMYLYVKTHIITGLKYLGYTKSKDPHRYNGSGLRWNNHLRVHGKTYTTQILLATEDKAELIETGLFFSKLWAVVDSDEWANLKPEEGDGGWLYINSKRNEFYESTIGVSNPAKLESVKKKISESNMMNSDKHIASRRLRSIEKYGTDHYSKNHDALIHRNDALMSKYGVENIAQLDSVKLKMIKTRNSQEFKDSTYIWCKYCNKLVDPGNHKRWHGENCSLKTVNGEAFV